MRQDYYDNIYCWLRQRAIVGCAKGLISEIFKSCVSKYFMSNFDLMKNHRISYDFHCFGTTLSCLGQSEINEIHRNFDDFSLNSRYFANQRDVNPENFRKYLFHHIITLGQLFSHFYARHWSRAISPLLNPLTLEHSKLNASYSMNFITKVQAALTNFNLP